MSGATPVKLRELKAELRNRGAKFDRISRHGELWRLPNGMKVVVTEGVTGAVSATVMHSVNAALKKNDLPPIRHRPADEVKKIRAERVSPARALVRLLLRKG